MSYQTDFQNDSGWSAVDVSTKLTTSAGETFLRHLKDNDVNLIIRYYASTPRPKVMSAAEAKLLSREGFAILPVFQNRNRLPEDFTSDKGRANAQSALASARAVGQPAGTCILFAVDADFSPGEIEANIVPYFREVRAVMGTAFRVGAYGGGAALSTLLERGLIDVPWLSMSRLFHGTRDFFYSDRWAFRQVPPDHTHPASGIGYDRNVLSWPVEELGAFQVDEGGIGVAFGFDPTDAVLGGGVAAQTSMSGATARAGVNAYVSTEGLNLRETPDGTVLRELTIGEPVRDLGGAGVDGWRRVEVDGRSGVVFGKYLRKPSTPEVEALLAATIAEWVRFEKGTAVESIDPYCQYVGEMWESIGEPYDGRSRYPNGDEVPWSAAFISFVVRRAGPMYGAFKFADGHSKFSHDAIQARILDRRDRPFWGYRRTEAKPEIGDIIHKNRGSGAFTFDYAENHSQFKSHSDLVVEVTSHVVRVIGGNVDDTVSMRDGIQEYRLDENGFIAPDQRVIALLKNRASEVILSV